nr:unnamed protein product [Digitaria exilis]
MSDGDRRVDGHFWSPVLGETALSLVRERPLVQLPRGQPGRLSSCHVSCLRYDLPCPTTSGGGMV